MAPLDSLVQQWRSEAQMLRKRGGQRQAVLLESCAEELERERDTWLQEELSVAEAAKESGYSEESLRRMARDGRLPCERGTGAKSRIRLRRGDLPKRPHHNGGGDQEPNLVYDPEEDARDIAKRLPR